MFKKSLGVLGMFLLGALLVLATAETASAQMKLGFKLGGGAGFLFNGGGDLEKTRLGREAWTMDYGAYDWTPTFNWKKASFAPNFNFDFILGFGRNFGVGVGFGYIGLASKGDYSLTDKDSGSPWWGSWSDQTSNEYTHDYKVSAFAIPVNFFFFMPMGSMTFYGYTGLGFYKGKFDHEYNYKYSYDYSDTSWYYLNITSWEIRQNQTTTETAKANTLGFQGGVGLKINFSRAVGISFEMFGRLANFKNWTGDFEDRWNFSEKISLEYYGQIYNYSTQGIDSDAGTLWFYDYYISGMGEYANMWLFDSKPTGTSYRNVREGSLNLNAFGLSVTLFILFDLF